MSEIGYFTNHCQFCSGGIEFPINGVGEQIECPHCHKSITLIFPKQIKYDPIEQIETFLKNSSFPTTKVELIFLKKYSFPQEVIPSPQLQMWRNTLNEEPLKVIDRFLAESLIQNVDLDLTKQLQYKSSNELKAMAKERGVPHSRTKETIAERLVKSDPEGIARLFSDKVYLACSHKGQILVDKFEEAESYAKQHAENQSLEALKQFRFKDACLAVTTYRTLLESNAETDVDSQENNIEVLQIIFAAQLSRHTSFEENIIFNLRVCAAMMHLWGVNDPRPWLDYNYSQFDSAVESRMLLFYALEIIRRKQMKSAGIRRVKILSSGNNDDCPTCRSDEGKSYSIDAAPVLPLRAVLVDVDADVSLIQSHELMPVFICIQNNCLNPAQNRLLISR
jgi:hypothetical protein